MDSAKKYPSTRHWIETQGDITRDYHFDSSGVLRVNVLNDSRPVVQKIVDSFLNTFFPLGYPDSVAEGYLTYTKFRALQHFSSAAVSVLSTQACVLLQLSLQLSVGS
eukprot:TRINITY_DN4045_c0_g1_i1.p1 TRINITY_DN4045_c0_g1~~TRINITY_DN4045_c0_g1_i1.p1  ORF type:complete len:107 (+),score=14.10 TRINITY_DN4045_c0_g1_i1:193-513(+)